MRDNPHDSQSRLLGALIMCSVSSLLFFIAYQITSFIYRFTGRPSEMFAQMISGLTVVFIIGLIWMAAQRIGNHSRGNDGMTVRNQLTDALAQISQGNFNVLLDPATLGWYHDLAEAINDMAYNLGTLETMRQDFISNVSHEIQSPLTSISGFAELLLQGDITDEQRQDYASTIKAESKRLSSLSENLLKLSTLDNKAPLNKQLYRLDKQLERVALSLEPQWAVKRQTFEAYLTDCAVYADEDLLLIVWTNLLQNAIKFTPEDGEIKIEIVVTDDRVLVGVTDTGIGITAEDQVHVFERFYKADRARDRSLGGNGLGLSLVKKIVELHGGSVTVQSSLGEGSTFTVDLTACLRWV